MCHQVFGVLQHRLRGCRIFKVADEDNANAVAVVVGCVRALQAEATALVDTAIAGNYKVVANIAKLAALLVIGLNVLDEALAFRLGAAGIRNVGMMNDDIVDLAGYACGRASRRRVPGTPWLDPERETGGKRDPQKHETQ